MKFPKFRLLTQSRLETLINDAVDSALTKFRQIIEFDKPTATFEDDFSTPSVFQESPRLKLTAKDLGIKEESQDKVRKHVIEAVVDTFVANPFNIREQSQEELWVMQDAAVAKYLTDPHAVSIVNNIKYYTMGSGLQIKCPDPKVQDVLRQFNTNNLVDRRCKTMAHMTFLEGEYFLAMYVNPKTGDVFIRRVPPKEITEIETAPNDRESIFAYRRQATVFKSDTLDKWIEDVDYAERQARGEFGTSGTKNEADKNVYIFFMKYGMEDEIRGRVPMQPVLKFLKYYEDFLVDRIRLNHERAKVVWIKSIKGRSPESLVKDRKSPRGGSMLIENENVTYRIESAKLDSGDAEKDGMLILYYIGSGVTMPIHILDQRADQQVYASIRKADTPFAQMIMDNQDFWYLNWEKIYRTVIREKVKVKQLPETTKVKTFMLEAQVAAAQFINMAIMEGQTVEEVIPKAKKMLDAGATETVVKTIDIPLDIVFPDMVTENALEQAQVLQIHRNIGIASRTTLSTKAGYNWQMELRNMKAEDAELPDSENPEKAKLALAATSAANKSDGRANNTRTSSPKTNAPE